MKKFNLIFLITLILFLSINFFISFSWPLYSKLKIKSHNYNKEQITPNNYDLSLKEARIEFEKEYLLSQIKRFSGNITKVSEFTGMERTALYRKLKSLNISVN